VADLNLRPAGIESFEAFAKSKGAPAANAERVLLCVFWLRQVAGLGKVSPDHLYTCFTQLRWKVPSDLRNTLSWIASKKGWLVTSDMNDIQLTIPGENYVQHDMGNKTGK
jgi:hypothetical protein